MSKQHPEAALDVVPHDIIGYLALSLVGVAMAIFVGSALSGTGLALVLGAIVGVIVTIRLVHRATRERIEEASSPGDDRDGAN